MTHLVSVGCDDPAHRIGIANPRVAEGGDPYEKR